ncbi:scavenger receptor class F member 1-like isoform X3 [Haliotis rubra]|uniref:scavenger receptor class F member 1-like isoform X3 n=1 Tax=Haliotis rubra TaxID=36100 RepID=UPI001EE5FB89|nr:scavenger receptor class F member 1-like isoform X3 [Haliotis rubra]
MDVDLAISAETVSRVTAARTKPVAHTNGTCVEGCRPGYFGDLCNNSCEVCRDGICDQKTGACINGCDVSEGACERSCTSNCSMDYCLNAPTCDADSKVNVINIGLPTGCVAFLLALLVSHYICYRKGHAARRTDPEGTPSIRQTTSRNSQHIYSDIKEEDMGQVIVFL